MSRVFWDTNLFIYFFENHPKFGPEMREMYNRMLKRGDQLITSAMTLGEILVKPRETGDLVLSSRYEAAIRASALIVPFDTEAAIRYSALRTDKAIKAPDAIQLSCAAVARIDVFLTNDSRLHNTVVDGIHFIVPMERSPI